MVKMLTMMKLPLALSHSHIILFFVSLPCLLVSDIMCFSHHLIVVSPSQTLRHRPNHAFFLSPVGFYNRVSLTEATDLLTAEVWRSIICFIWFLGKISIFRYFLSSSFLDLEITCVCSVLAWTEAIFPWIFY